MLMKNSLNVLNYVKYFSFSGFYRHGSLLFHRLINVIYVTEIDSL